MSLKNFHIVLISLASLLGLLVGGWALAAYREGGGAASLVMAIVSFAGAVGLAVYVVWFTRTMRTRDEDDARRRKMFRSLAIFAGVLLSSAAARPALACTVCYGEAEGPMIDAARMGVYLLFGLVLAVQLAFATFFLYLRRRSARLAE